MTSSLGCLTNVSNITCPKLHSCSFFYISDPIYQPTVSTKSSKYIQILTISLHLRYYNSDHFSASFPTWITTTVSKQVSLLLLPLIPHRLFSNQQPEQHCSSEGRSSFTMSSLHQPLWPHFLLLSPPTSVPGTLAHLPTMLPPHGLCPCRSLHQVNIKK